MREGLGAVCDTPGCLPNAYHRHGPHHSHPPLTGWNWIPRTSRLKSGNWISSTQDSGPAAGTPHESRTVIRTPRPGRRPFAGLLAVALLSLPTGAWSQDADAKKIAEIEKQIADLQKKLAELKKAPADAGSAEGAVPDAYVKKMNWRSIGPANMAGRVTALAVVESDPSTYYVATASGGLVKTTNNGTTFAHLFDHEGTVSIGDVAVAPSDPKVVWVGTGEANPRNSVSYGDGVYKSTDGGKTWTHCGLKKTYSIGKILIHPKNPDTVYVGAMGRVYGPNKERGVFKTTNGGKDWQHVLAIDDRTGVIDMRMDPNDPETLVVAAWERRRDEFDGYFGAFGTWPTTDQYGPAVSHGPGGGLYKTTDGGKNWKRLSDAKLKNGLPTAATGRIGLDHSRKTKGLLVAIIDTEKVGTGTPPGPAAYMGVVGENVEKDGGAKLTEIVEGGPAAKAGLKAGDVVTAVDGTKVASYDALVTYFQAKKPGDKLKLTVTRGDKELPLELTLGTRPGSEPAADPKAKSRLMPGFTPALGEGGQVTVGSVPAGGPAEKAGVKAGMDVVAIDGKEVANFREFLAALRTAPEVEDGRKAGDKVRVTFKQGEKKVEADLPLVSVEMTIRTGGQAPASRPYLLSTATGGQRPNVQDRQGADGFNTGGVYVSKDGGDTWSRVNSLNPRPFYFSVVRFDPNDDNTLYVTADRPALYRSTDGGKSFAAAPSRGVHDDLHALWIDPRDSRHMLVGCDGGFYVTYDKGDTWDHLNTLALGQFYHVTVDSRKPYRVYGGLQDNGSWGGPSHTLRAGRQAFGAGQQQRPIGWSQTEGDGPVNEDWFMVGQGDGFTCRVDPYDPDIVYSTSQNGGGMGWRNLRTGERGFIGFGTPTGGGKGGKGGGKGGGGKGGAGGAEPKRFNWNTPYILSNHNANIFYFAGQQVYRSVKRGAESKTISPDITRTKMGTATALAESLSNPDVLWAGTDDGFLWVTRDGGETWTNVTDKLKAAGLSDFRWVASIEPSRVRDKTGRCYVALDAHRSDDDKPYLFVTEDYGQTWKSIAGNLPEFGSTRVLREDVVNPDLLYAGTEFGVWASVNRGASWTRLNNNLPTVAVHEVAQPTTASEIVVATHGRSIWVLDVASLRQMTPAALKASATLFAPGPAVRWRPAPGPVNVYSMEVRKFYGTNPYRGAVIDYLLTQSAKEVSLKVLDVTGKTVQDFRGAAKEPGFHRVQWNLTRSGGGAAVVPAGGYRVVLTVDGKEYVQAVVVENDPNADPKAAVTAAGVGLPDGRDEDEPVPFIPASKE